MKKIIIAFLVSIFLVGNTFARNASKEETELYRNIILTRAKIERDFSEGKSYNDLLSKFFERLRADQNISRVNDIDAKFGKMVSEFSGKRLSTQDEKLFNLILNIYYRNKILKDFHLKDVSRYSNTKNNTISNTISNTIRNNNNNNNNDNRVIISNNRNTNSINRVISNSNDNNRVIISSTASKSTMITNDVSRKNDKILLFLDSDGMTHTSGKNLYKKISSSTNSYGEENKSFTTMENVDFSYSYKIPKGWFSKKGEDDMEVILENNRYSDRDSVKLFATTSNTSFNKFKDDFSSSLRGNKLKNFSEFTTRIDGEYTYGFEYKLDNGDQKTIYMIEYKGLIFFIDSTKKDRNDSSSDIKEIINSIKIGKGINKVINNNSSSDYKNNTTTSSYNNSSKTSSLSYSYKIPAKWTERNSNNEGETILTNENFYDRDSIVLNILSYREYNSFDDFKNNFERELKRDSSIRNFKDYKSRIDGKTSYVFNYFSDNGDEKYFYLTEYNGLVLVVNVTRKRNNNSDRDINDIINSIRINK